MSPRDVDSIEQSLKNHFRQVLYSNYNDYYDDDEEYVHNLSIKLMEAAMLTTRVTAYKDSMYYSMPAMVYTCMSIEGFALQYSVDYKGGITITIRI